ETTSMVGVLLASIAVSVLLELTINEHLWWRLLYAFGALSAVFGWQLQKQLKIKTMNSVEYSNLPTVKILRQYAGVIAINTIQSGATMLTYIVPFVLLNILVPQVNQVQYDTMLQFNNGIILADIGLILLFKQWWSYQQKVASSIKWLWLIMAVIVVPLMHYLPVLNATAINIVKLLMVAIGVAALVPCYDLQQQYRHLLPPGQEYLVLGLAYKLGGSLIASTMPAISLIIWRYSGSMALIGAYIAFWWLLAAYYARPQLNP
ncbi:MAG: hypothetical protein AAF153_02170, partial [Pseudomonadota bacterium]